VDVNWLEDPGAKTPQTFNVEIPAQLTGEKYEARLPLDEFPKGDRQWGPSGIMAAVRPNGNPPIKIERHIDSM
jgi:hypothetical protein